MSSTILDCDAVLFDLDGVLVDSEACIQHVLRDWAAVHGFDMAPVTQAAHGRRPVEWVRTFAPDLDAASEAAWFLARESQETRGLHAMPGARQLVESLPRYAWAVVTSCDRPLATVRMQAAGLPTPPLMICGDDIVRGKPDPEGYSTAAQRLGLAPERCIVIEDAFIGIQAAHAAGMRVIGVFGTRGFDEVSEADVVAVGLASIEPEVTTIGEMRLHVKSVST